MECVKSDGMSLVRLGYKRLRLCDYCLTHGHPHTNLWEGHVLRNCWLLVCRIANDLCIDLMCRTVLSFLLAMILYLKICLMSFEASHIVHKWCFVPSPVIYPFKNPWQRHPFLVSICKDNASKVATLQIIFAASFWQIAFIKLRNTLLILV